jgi:hypothetical protein
LSRSHHRLGAFDAACQPKPVLADADDLAATLDEIVLFEYSSEH